jgi:hypothetical protein
MDIIVAAFSIVTIVAILVGIIILSINGKRSDEDSIYKENTVHDGSITITYTGGTRCVDGKPIKTGRDWNRWAIVKGTSTHMEFYIRNLEVKMNDPRVDNAQDVYKEWKARYKEYREYCMRHKLWNFLIDDRTSFIPTEKQLIAEKQYLHRIERQFSASHSKRESYQEEQNQLDAIKASILNYIKSQPGKRAVRHIMFKQLAENSDLSDSLIRRAYRALLKDGTIGEKKNENNRIITRIIHRRKEKLTEQSSSTQASTTAPFRPSVYNPALYANVSPRLFDKARYAVTLPAIITNRSSNACDVQSMSSDAVYHTTLESCTCPAFEREQPCKHMVALAVRLGYLHEN